MKTEIRRKKTRFYLEILKEYNSCFCIFKEYYTIKELIDLNRTLKNINCKVLLINNNETKFILKNFFIHQIDYTVKDLMIFIFCKNFFQSAKILYQYNMKKKKVLNNIYAIILNKRLDRNKIMELSKLHTREELKRKLMYYIIFFTIKFIELIKKVCLNLVFLIKIYTKKNTNKI